MLKLTNKFLVEMTNSKHSMGPKQFWTSPKQFLTSPKCYRHGSKGKRLINLDWSKIVVALLEVKAFTSFNYKRTFIKSRDVNLL